MPVKVEGDSPDWLSTLVNHSSPPPAFSFQAFSVGARSAVVFSFIRDGWMRRRFRGMRIGAYGEISEAGGFVAG